MQVAHEPADVRARFGEFRYTGVEAAGTVLTLRYELAGGIEHLAFEEVLEFPAGTVLDLGEPGVTALARLLHLTAGLSYYKAAAPGRIHVEGGVTGPEASFLGALVLRGLGEFAYRNALPGPLLPDILPGRDAEVAAAEPELLGVPAGRPLVPVGGGKDSVVTLELLRRAGLDPVAFSVNSFVPIEDTVAVAGAEHLVVRRTLDPRLLELNRTPGFLNGHVPVTAVNSLIALLTARARGLGPVVMSNERSAGSGNVSWRGLEVNHQYSKSWEFEQLLRSTLSAAGLSADSYFSFLRTLDEYAIAERFAAMPEYHDAFTSCNRAFRLDPSRRGTRWCAECSKCRFVFLILAPFLGRARLTALIGRDLLDDPDSLGDLRELLGLAGHKPFECVGEVLECRRAFADVEKGGEWAGSAVVAELARELGMESKTPDAQEFPAAGALPDTYRDLLRAAP